MGRGKRRKRGMWKRGRRERRKRGRRERRKRRGGRFGAGRPLLIFGEWL